MLLKIEGIGVDVGVVGIKAEQSSPDQKKHQKVIRRHCVVR